MRHVVVMVATSYPRFPGDGVGSFMEPIAKSVAARGHEVHLVAPWHPAITRGNEEDGVFFHFFTYAPVPSLNVFGYAGGLRADTHLKAAAWLAAPLAMSAGWFKAWRVAAKRRATVMHGHWVVPGGVIAAAAAGRLPLVISLHGSDVYVAERHAVARRAARYAFGRAGWVTACSDDLRTRACALGAAADRIETVPYGVDVRRFAPAPDVRAEVRRALELGDAPVVFSAGRLVRKKGFEFLIDAVRAIRRDVPDVRLVIAGEGDLGDELRVRAADLAGHVFFAGNMSQDMVGRMSAAADVVAVPSVHDDQGNVDGLPNFALEAMATATPVVATRAGGLPSVIENGRTGLLVPERDAAALGDALRAVLQWPAARRRDVGERGRARISTDFGWPRVGERLEAAYDRAKQSTT
jgi:glycosyltransferase involved in cell wall biosynthesis